ncbi:MAG: hypothetical protein QOJ94_2870 [Sphingomonadales bacterium]|jgi:hypothetical protein|nr:hypothetical protein [Sphingomonadales bacterium]
MKLPFLAGVAAAALLSAGCGGSGTSAKGSALAADFDKAADALLAKMAAARGELPGKDDPAVRDYDDAASRAMAAVGTDDLPATGFESFSRICGKGTRIIQAYANGGTAGGLVDAQTMTANLQRYMDQMFTPLLFSAHCTAAHLPAIDKTFSEEDLRTKASAVARIRGGAWAQASGLLEMAGDPTFDPARRQRIMDLLAGDAGNFAIVFSAAQRQELARTAQSIKPLLPKDSQPDADRVSEAVAKAPCGKFCKAG